ncbi:hypothetical protein ACFQZQ_10845 [Lysobacter koreensis]|uniref:Uncharacterized protein n=1 Tax=Lysobacter koreensis TaxID=266122 RepID=A0ABW2YN17_9GAMM
MPDSSFKAEAASRLGLIQRLAIMHRWLAVFSILASLSACASVAPISHRVAGCYAAGDGIGYNRLRLCLDRDGTYTSQLAGDIGPWHEASGTWSLSGDMIQLVAKTEKPVDWLARVRVASDKVLEPLSPSGELAWEPLKRESP